MKQYAIFYGLLAAAALLAFIVGGPYALASGIGRILGSGADPFLFIPAILCGILVRQQDWKPVALAAVGIAMVLVLTAAFKRPMTSANLIGPIGAALVLGYSASLIRDLVSRARNQ